MWRLPIKHKYINLSYITKLNSQNEQNWYRIVQLKLVMKTKFCFISLLSTPPEFCFTIGETQFTNFPQISPEFPTNSPEIHQFSPQFPQYSPISPNFPRISPDFPMIPPDSLAVSCAVFTSQV